MKLRNILISGWLMTAAMADNSAAGLRRLKADSKASKRSSKAAKSSNSYSSSMSYGPPTPPSPVPPTPRPTPAPTPPSTGCCNAAAIRQTILENVYPGSDDSVFNNSPQKEAIEWLVKDACECGLFCNSPDRLVQRYILAVFYYSTKGDSWDSCSAPANMQDAEQCQPQSRIWLTCTTECGWAGTSCSGENELFQIQLQDNGLAGQLAAELGRLPKLFALVLSKNNIGGSIPASYSELTSLKHLFLNFNSLSGSMFDVSGLTKLQDVHINDNNLDGTIEGLGWENTKIRYLSVHNNKFTGVIAPEFGDIASLRLVQFQCNQFEVSDMTSWSKCPGAFYADDYICDSGLSCECLESYTPADCAAVANISEGV